MAYEDSRTRFLGPGGLARPRGLGPEGRRAPDDEGSLYTFDPAAALTVRGRAAAQGARRAALLTGRAADEWAAARLIAPKLGRPAPDEAAFRALLRRKRAHRARPRPARLDLAVPLGATTRGSR